MGLVTSDRCTNCSLNTLDTYFHALWLSPPVYQFYKLSEFFLIKINALPLLWHISNEPFFWTLKNSAFISSYRQNNTKFQLHNGYIY